MSVNSISSPYPIFTDIDGDPLEAGYIYIGEGEGSIIDKTNVFTSNLQHVGSGSFETYTSSGTPPLYGYYKIGDRVINRTAIVGSPKAWRCTTAGQPGTWTSEGVQC